MTAFPPGAEHTDGRFVDTETQNTESRKLWQHSTLQSIGRSPWCVAG